MSMLLRGTMRALMGVTLTPVQRYEQVVNTLAPLLWYKMNESATPAVNYGSVGSAADGVAANVSFQQAGPNAAIPLAVEYNGTTSIITSAQSAGLQSTDCTLACLVNPDNAGEASFGQFFNNLTTAAALCISLTFSGSINGLSAIIRNTVPTAFSTTTTTGLTAGAWAWVFMQFNTADNKIRLWKSVAGVLTEFAYSAQPALTGTPRQIARVEVGNRTAGDTTWDGKYAQFMLFGRLLTTNEMQSIITASGVAA